MSAESIAYEGRSEREPNVPRDVVAITLVAVTLLLTVSLVTRSAADPVETPSWPLSAIYVPDVVAYPSNPVVTNACGYWGALLSSALLDSVGLASVVLIASLGALAASLLLQPSLQSPVTRSLGATILLAGVATTAAMVPVSIEGMPVVGNGGYLGAMTSTWLLEHFAPTGAWILTFTALSVGVLLTSDYALVHLGGRVAKVSFKISRTGMHASQRVLPALKRKRQPFTDTEEPITLDNEGQSTTALIEPEPTIKIRKPKVKPQSEELQQTEDDQDSEEWIEDQETGHWDAEVDEQEWDHEEESSLDESEESLACEVELEDEKLSVRGDTDHEVPPPKIRNPKRKEKSDPREEILDGMSESAPSGIEDYRLPSLELLQESDDFSYEEQRQECLNKSEILRRTFRDFGFNIAVEHIEIGPVISQYEIKLEAGLRLSKITGLSDDLAIALRVPSVRIVAPIPGKNTVGIEVPNETRQVVRLRDVIEESDTQSAKMNIPVFLGKDVSGTPMVVDLAKMPHLLIAGRTGTGKSVCLNAIITSVLMCCRPDEVRMLMIDPKMVELSGYGRLPHLMHPVITDMQKAEAILAWAVEKMEERYSLLAKVGVRHINTYNDLGREEVLRRLEVDESADGQANVPEKLPFIVIVADEMADLMMTAGKDVEQHIIRLAQKSRAVGIHLILATQKPTVDVITGLIKSNLPARLSFQVASKTDSRVVLDENGADKLLGNGDMLFLWPGTSTLIRGQGTYLSDEEIDTVCEHCSAGEQNFVGELMNLKVTKDEDAEAASMETIKKRDPLYDSAIEVVIREGRGSCSLLQRCLGIGYGRAAKLIDFMAEDGIVGDYNGSKAREVILTMAQWNAMQGIEDEEDEGSQEDAISAEDEGSYDETDYQESSSFTSDETAGLGAEEDEVEYDEVEDDDEEYEDVE